MEQKRRFKADISNTYIQGVFSRKKPIQKSRSKDKSALQNIDKTVFNLPTNLLPATKKWDKQPKDREYKKPDHWKINPYEDGKAPKDEVLKAEWHSIEKRIKGEHGWSRAVRSLSTVRNLNNSDNVDDSDYQQVYAKAYRDAKNRPREFLRTFMDNVDTKTELGGDEDEKQSNKCTARVPKIANGVEPGTDEIIL